MSLMVVNKIETPLNQKLFETPTLSHLDFVLNMGQIGVGKLPSRFLITNHDIISRK